MANIAVLVVMADPPWAVAASGRYYAKVDGREAFLRTLELYANRDSVEQRILCVLPDDLSRISSKYAPNLGFQGVSVATGGPDWFGAVARGLEKLDSQIQWVVLHDAACPVVPQSLLDALEEGVVKFGAACPVTPMTTLITRSGMGAKRISPEALKAHGIQSPCIFSRPVICHAYANRGGAAGYTDDCGLVEAAGGGSEKGRITTIAGAPMNLRIDSDELVRVAGDLIRHLPKPKIKAPASPFDEAQW